MPQAYPNTPLERAAQAAIVLFIVASTYVASSGPVMAVAFWLREKTHWDGFYGVMFLYFPLLALGHDQPLDWYIEWWVGLVGAPGPG